MSFLIGVLVQQTEAMMMIRVALYQAKRCNDTAGPGMIHPQRQTKPQIMEQNNKRAK